MNLTNGLWAARVGERIGGGTDRELETYLRTEFQGAMTVAALLADGSVKRRSWRARGGIPVRIVRPAGVGLGRVRAAVGAARGTWEGTG